MCHGLMTAASFLLTSGSFLLMRTDIAAAWTAAYGILSGYMISEAYGSAQAAECGMTA